MNRRAVALLVCLCAVCFAAGYALGHATLRRTAPPVARTPADFLDEVSASHAAHARLLEELRDDPAALAEAHARHRLDVRAIYRRHGRELPAAMRGAD